MYEINRMAIIIKPNEHFLDWVNSLSHEKEKKLSLEALQSDCTVVLIPLLDNLAEIHAYLNEHFDELFENELEAWCLDESKWPKHRDYETFLAWFSLSTHSYVYDAEDDEGGEGEFTLVTVQ